VQTFDTHCLGRADPDVAASENLVGTVIQWNAYFYKKDGTPDHEYQWSALQGSLVSDTHIVYDKSSQRWFITTIVDLGNNNYGVQIMVSSDATATSWQASIPIKNNALPDNPQPTVTADKVVIGSNATDCLWVMDKTALYAGNAAVVQPAKCGLSNVEKVAVKYGGTPPSTAYSITTGPDSMHVIVYTVDGTPAMNNVKVQEHLVMVDTGDDPGGITTSGGEATDGWVKAMWHNNHLVWGLPNKNSACATPYCVRILDVDTSNYTATYHDMSLAGAQLWYGEPGLDSKGNTWVLMAEAPAGGNNGLALGGILASGQLVNPYVIKQGQSGLGSFGDYFSSAQDPVDGSSWLIGQWGGVANSTLNPENSTAQCTVVHVTAHN
jgi:hypothetical protein